MKPVLVCGGYGIFGTHVCRELVKTGVPVTVAGRDAKQAAALAAVLGNGCKSLTLDLTKAKACRAAVKEHAVAVNCAGPFNNLDATLLEGCLDSGCHYADITDNRAYATLVRSYDQAFRARGLAAVYGCSSFPGISGALALKARDGTTTAIARVRATLFIGNKNPKGEGAIGSLLACLGQPIAAPQGILRGFADREVVDLPPPFGRRAVFNFETPDYDTMPSLVGTGAVSVKVGFELRLVNYTFALLARLGFRLGSKSARFFGLVAKPFSRFGSSGGAVFVELFLADGQLRSAAVFSANDGQRMAALPCALVARALSKDDAGLWGSSTAYEFLGADPLLAGLVGAGIVLHVGEQKRMTGRTI